MVLALGDALAVATWTIIRWRQRRLPEKREKVVVINIGESVMRKVLTPNSNLWAESTGWIYGPNKTILAECYSL
jgi:hypothetical protein